MYASLDVAVLDGYAARWISEGLALGASTRLQKDHYLDEVRQNARVRTLATLRRLDGDYKRDVLEFLHETQLINKNQRPVYGFDNETPLQPRIVGLDGSDLRGADLRYIRLTHAALNSVILDRADLSGAALDGIDLGGAYLRGAYLRGASLRNASLRNADLRDADLRDAELHGAIGVTEGQLEQQAWSLEGAIMPDGQKYEDWLKDREDRKEDVENE